MPILPLLATNAMIGLACAWVARSELRLSSRSALGSAAFGLLFVGQALLMVPLATYLLVFYPDWSALYLVPTRSVPSLGIAMVLLGHPLCAAAGFFGAVSLARSGREPVVLGLLGGLCVFILATLGLTWRRVGLVGTFDQWHRVFGLEPLYLSGLGLFLALAVPAVAAAWVWGLWRLRRLALKSAK